MEYSSDSSSYSDAVKRNINKDKANFWDTYKNDSDEDNQSANSSTFRSFSIALPNNNNITTKEEKVGTDIKKENKKLKRKAKNLKRYIKKLQKQVHVQTQYNINKGIDKECVFSANIIDNNNNSRSTYVPAEEENTEEQNIATQNTLKRVATEEDREMAFIHQELLNLKNNEDWLPF